MDEPASPLMPHTEVVANGVQPTTPGGAARRTSIDLLPLHPLGSIPPTPINHQTPLISISSSPKVDAGQSFHAIQAMRTMWAAPAARMVTANTRSIMTTRARPQKGEDHHLTANGHERRHDPSEWTCARRQSTCMRIPFLPYRALSECRSSPRRKWFQPTHGRAWRRGDEDQRTRLIEEHARPIDPRLHAQAHGSTPIIPRPARWIKVKRASPKGVSQKKRIKHRVRDRLADEVGGVHPSGSDG